MPRLILGGVIIKRRPLAVVLREMWERALCRAVCRGDMATAEQLAAIYEGYEDEAQRAGRN